MPAGPDTATPQPPSIPAPASPAPNSWAALWDMVTRIQRDKITPALGFRNAIGVALPIAAGVAVGAIQPGLAVSTGALNVSFSDSAEPYIVRGWRMLAASVLVGMAVASGEICGNNLALAIVVSTGWAFAAGLLVALSTTAADLGAVSLVTLLVYAGFPSAPHRALLAGLLALGGGLFQTILSLAFWPIRRYVPERRALGSLYLELSRSASAPIRATEAPPASGQSTQAQQALAALGRDHSVEGERYRALLSQAERLRLSLMMLGRLRIRLERDQGDPGAGILDRYFEITARLLESIAQALQSGSPGAAAPDSLALLHALSDTLRAPDPTRTAASAAMIDDSRHQMDALTGQLRSAVDLAAYATPEGANAFEQRESRRPWSLRLMGTLAILRANLSLQSAACRHAIRLSLCIAVGEAIAHGFSLHRAYWLPMTIAIILKPDFSATFSRGLLRLTGTLAGLVFATVMFHLLPPHPVTEVAMIFVLMFVLRWVGGANYGIFVIAVTTLVVVLLAINGTAPKDVIRARGVNTLIGGAVALLAYWVWPTWERRQLPEALARMLDGYRIYFHTIHKSYTEPGKSFAADLDRARQAARLARSNLEASADRLTAEPGTPAAMTGIAAGILANSHRLAHAIMALEAGLASSHPVPAREQFSPFANAVELTLYYLAAALRGSPLKREELPDLREAHSTLTHSGSPLTERYALVNVETDRITNSLNTLCEEILRWLRT